MEEGISRLPIKKEVAICQETILTVVLQVLRSVKTGLICLRLLLLVQYCNREKKQDPFPQKMIGEETKKTLQGGEV